MSKIKRNGCIRHTCCRSENSRSKVDGASETGSVTMMKPEQERIRSLLVDTISLLCRNGLNFENEVRVQAVIGITLDKDECFVVHINKCFERLEEENCENEQQLNESLQETADAAAATQPADESAEVIQSTQELSVKNLSPCGSEQNKRSHHQQQVSANSVALDECTPKSEVQVAKSGSAKHEAFDDCAEFDASRTRVNMRSSPAHVESDECDDSSVMMTDSVVFQQKSMTGKQRAVNGCDVQQPYYKSSQPTRHKPQRTVDAYRPKTKKRNPCEDLFDTEDDCCDDFTVGQQYMYIDAGSLRARPKLSKQQQQLDVFFDPHCTPSMLAAGGGHQSNDVTGTFPSQQHYRDPCKSLKRFSSNRRRPNRSPLC